MITSLLSWVSASQAYFQGLGWLGIVAYAGIIVLVQLCLVPVSPLAMASGVIFGYWGGFLAVTLGTGFAVAFNFIIARHLARKPIERRLARSEKFRLIDEAIGREGWKIIAMLRFCPLPFGLSNFCYGLTAIPFWPYFLASVAVITPVNMFFVWLGTSAHASAEALAGAGRPRHPIEYVLMGVGIVAGFCALTYVGTIARAAVAKADKNRERRMEG
jgi:uncharacterized membrane protein YdjX (TVP38/TMEM64 family)